MSIQNGTIADGASLSAAGGTSKTLTANGAAIKNGIQVIDASVTDFRLRPTLTFKNKVPTLLPSGMWSKGVREFSVTIPYVDGVVQKFPIVRVKIEDYPDMTVAAVDKLVNYAAQVLIDIDFESYRRTGNLS